MTTVNTGTKEERFNRIVAENSEKIRRICRYYSSNRENQKEMFQEVLINIWKSLDRFRGQSAISTWIYRIAVNSALTHIGKISKRLNTSLYVDLQKIHLFSDEDHSQEFLRKEAQIEKLQSELNLLSIIDKTLISLTLEGISTKEIAEVIGITEPNVRVKIHRIKTDLKNKLSEDNHGDQW